MKILLVGEYSRLHNSLKEGLIALGHEVTLISSGDGMKGYPSDVLLYSKIKNNRLLNKLNSLSIRFFKTDFIKKEYAHQFKKALPNLKNYDVIQFINEDALFLEPKISIKLFKTLIEQNKKVFLLSCGEDFKTVSYFLKPNNGYSILTPYLNSETSSKHSEFSLKYVNQDFKTLHDFLTSKVNGIISSDMDYHRAYINTENYLGLIPNPINTTLFSENKLVIDDKIYIFHGINSSSRIKKGNQYFTKALTILKEKHINKIVIIEASNLPYNIYIERYNKAHIVLDQTYSYDQGYNALEAMAKGKVVFTGAEKEWRNYYNLEENTVCINALPNVDYLVSQLEKLILNPERIIAISKEAKAFIHREHNYTSIAKKYIETWNSN